MGVHKLFGVVVSLFPALPATRGGGEHLVGLFGVQILSVESFAEECGVLGVGHLLFGLLQLIPRSGAGLDKRPQFFDFRLGASHFGRILSGLRV